MKQMLVIMGIRVDQPKAVSFIDCQFYLGIDVCWSGLNMSAVNIRNVDVTDFELASKDVRVRK